MWKPQAAAREGVGGEGGGGEEEEEDSAMEDEEAMLQKAMEMSLRDAAPP